MFYNIPLRLAGRHSLTGPASGGPAAGAAAAAVVLTEAPRRGRHSGQAAAATEDAS